MILTNNETIAPLTNAFEKFEALRRASESRQLHLELTQAFNECFDIMIYTLKRLLEEIGHKVEAAADILTLASLQGFLCDLQIWLKFLEKRLIAENIQSISHQENLDILSIQSVFSIEIHHFLDKIWVSF